MNDFGWYDVTEFVHQEIESVRWDVRDAERKADDALDGLDTAQDMIDRLNRTIIELVDRIRALENQMYDDGK